MHAVRDGVHMESCSCPNGCRLGDDIVLCATDRLHNLPGIFQIVRCRKCLLMRTNPRPTPETMGAYYPDDYGPYQTEAAIESPRATSKIKRTLLELFGMSSRRFPPINPGRLLELGCSNGAWLIQMNRSGWQVEGIEFSASAAEKAREKGLNVQVASVETAKAPESPVDIIAAWMVLEHLHEPAEALRKLREWIKPSGYLIASVPDASSLEFKFFGEYWYALQLPTHLYHYTPASINILLNTAGWEVKKIFWQKNCQNMLRSLEYVLEDKNRIFPLAVVRWVRVSPRANLIRIFLNWILGATRQSGRIEIWAQPIKDWKGVR